MQITGSPRRLSSVHSQVAVGPVSRPTRNIPGAFDLTNAAIASGSESTTPSRTTDPVSFTTQIDVCFNDTSSPTGTSSPPDKLTGDFGNAIEVIRIGDYFPFRLFARSLWPCNFRVLQQNRPTAAQIHIRSNVCLQGLDRTRCAHSEFFAF